MTADPFECVSCGAVSTDDDSVGHLVAREDAFALVPNLADGVTPMTCVVCEVWDR